MKEQLEFFDVPSPCIGVCQSNAQGYCRGCYRNRDERFHWQQLSNEQKSNVIRLCRLRKMKAIYQARAQKVQETQDQKNIQQGNLF